MIDVVVKKYEKTIGRAFVRPSGTEDLVRIYAEDNEMENVTAMTKEIEEILSKNPEINWVVFLYTRIYIFLFLNSNNYFLYKDILYC